MLGRVPVLLIAAAFLAAAASAFEYTSRAVRGPTAAWVNVRWAAHVDAARRDALERRFRLTRGEPREGTTFVYLLADTSSGNIREVVTHAEVADTHHIDRSAFTLASTAARVSVSDPAAQRRSRRAASAAAVLWTAAGAAVAWALIISSPPLRVRAANALRVVVRSVAAGLDASIPRVSAEAAALFRILFCSALLVCFLLTPVSAASIPGGTSPQNLPSLTRLAGGVFVAWPRLTDAIGPWLLVSGALSIAGAFTRVSFAAFTVGALAWGLVISLGYSHHPFSAALLAMVCLLPSRWGDAWSVDAWLHRRGRPMDPRDYGYTVWMPGVVLGLALAAAAAAKLFEGGIGWVLNGSVKYHILTDAEHAPVDWGLRFGLVPSVAVALSFGALAVESLVLPAALVRSWHVRLAAVAGGVGLFVAFWAFHGLRWPWWWILLLAFAPWHRVYSTRIVGTAAHDGAAAGGNRRLRHVQGTVVAVAIAQQLAASWWAVEVPPVISAYNMYSKTYGSPEEFVRSTPGSHWLIATMLDRTVSACRVSEGEAQTIASAPASKDVGGRGRDILARCFPDVRAVRVLTVEQERRNVDWAAGRYLGTMRVRVAGPVALAEGDRGPGR